MKSSVKPIVRATTRIAAGLALIGSAAGAQVQITFFESYPSAAPDPSMPYPGGNVICTASAAGTATGFSLNFGDAGQRALFCPGNPDRISPSNSFGARVTGSLVAPTAGTYELTINADDGDVLTVNGTTVRTDWVTKGGGPGLVGNLSLLAGSNAFVFDYFQGPCCGAFLELQTGAGLTVTPPTPPTTTTPEPASLALTASGLGVVAAGAWRRRRAA